MRPLPAFEMLNNFSQVLSGDIRWIAACKSKVFFLDRSLLKVYRGPRVSYFIQETDHNKALAARILGIHRTLLYKKIKKYGLDA
jgi:transcriptional regulator of acetoin/glycerol metabolism